VAVDGAGIEALVAQTLLNFPDIIVFKRRRFVGVIGRRNDRGGA
jgi:hypothetical protein